MNFTIDPSYLCSVTVREEYNIHAGKKSLTDDELVEVLKGNGKWTSVSNKDHDEFTELRNRLERDGFIKTQRGWWNGDRVLKEFSLNGAIFHPDDKFMCGAAIKHDVDWKIKSQNVK